MKIHHYFTQLLQPMLPLVHWFTITSSKISSLQLSRGGEALRGPLRSGGVSVHDAQKRGPRSLGSLGVGTLGAQPLPWERSMWTMIHRLGD